MPKKLVMVMGVQRSGTTALFKSLAGDPSVTAHEENIDDAVYCNYRLRPREELAHILDDAPGTVLLKPLSESAKRTRHIFQEFDDFALQIIWIYRDPVNVLYSMHREGWIPAPQLGQAAQVQDWNRRNRVALEMREHFAAHIAIVRYEDLLADPHVFRNLSEWLGLGGRPVFRPEASAGRKHLHLSVQRTLDAATSETMQALNAARTFPARTSQLGRRSISRILPTAPRARPAGRSRSQQRQFVWGKLREPSRSPAEVAGLRFWMDASAVRPSAASRAETIIEQGPAHLSARCPGNGPYHVACLNGKAALFFPHEKVEQRRRESSGILHFGNSQDWSFLVDGSSFALFVLFRPNVPCYAPYRQWRGVLLRVGSSGKSTPDFRLKWSHRSGNVTAVIAQGCERPKKLAVSARAQSHPRQEWRIASVQHSSQDQNRFTIWANNIPGETVCLPEEFRLRQDCRDCELQLGGIETRRSGLFYGAIAEIAIFDRALADEERLALTRYLKEKYTL